VIGGVITSTLLTLLVIPTVYEILDGMKEWLLVKLFGKRLHTGEYRVPQPAPEAAD
jgi:HAE1 family hydrophobic/amphiphilic exporter-1